MDTVWLRTSFGFVNLETGRVLYFDGNHQSISSFCRHLYDRFLSLDPEEVALELGRYRDLLPCTFYNERELDILASHFGLVWSAAFGAYIQSDNVQPLAFVY